MVADGAQLAHVDQRMLDAAGAQQFDDPVGDVALADAVQRDAHVRSRKTQARRIDLEPALPDLPDRAGDRLGGRTIGRGARLREVTGVESPQRLHRHVEGAAADFAVAPALGQHAHQVERRFVEHSVAIEARQRAVGPIEAHHLLEPPHLGEARRDQPVGRRRVGVVDLQRRVAAERRSRPDAQLRRRGARRQNRQQRQAAGGGGDGEEAAAGEAHGRSPEAEART